MPAKVKWTFSFIIGAALLWLGWLVPVFLTAFEVVLCIVLTLIILMQSGSAADLAGAFGGAGSQTAFGPRSAATFLTKATVWCATMFMAASLVISLRQSGGATGASSILSKTSMPQSSQPAPMPQPKTTLPVHLPATPAPAPAKSAPGAPAKPPVKH